ncbi:MAG: succinylglutamate desuccinylase/aspartoacylase family protein, partial [Pseudomonadota bacterium]
GMLDAEAIRQGKIFGCAELGSAGTLTPSSCGWTRRAVFNILRHFEMLDTDFTPISWKNKYDRTFISLTEMEQTIASPGNGIFRPKKIVGESVLSGEKIGTLLKLFDPEPSVEPIFSDRVGYIYTIASGRPVKPGDMLAVIAEEQTGRILKSPKANFVSEAGS